MHETMPQLDVSTFPSQIFWLVICFGVLCFAMATFLIPRIARSLAARQEELDTLKIKAQQLLAEADQLKHNNQDNFEKARQDANLKMHRMMTELKRDQDQHLANIDQKTQGIISTIQKSLHEQKNIIMKEMDRLIMHLSSEVFRRITGRQVDENTLKESIQLVQQNTTKNGAL